METSNLTKDRIKEYLAVGKRFDNRALDEHREITVETGISKKAEGSAKVKFGKTEVVVGIKMDVSIPYPDSQDEGTLMTTSELLPLSSDRYEAGPPKIEAIELARIIDRGIRESKVVDFKKLCIKVGEKVWTVFIDIYPLNEDGNLLDAAAFGALAALKNAKIPEFDEEKGRTKFGEWTENKLPLKKELPLTITVHKIGNTLLVDPNREEEDASEGRITFAMSGDDKELTINAMQKGLAKELSMEEFDKAIELAEKAFKNLHSKIEKIK